MEDAALVTPRDARDERATRDDRDRVTGVCAAALREQSIVRERARGRMTRARGPPVLRVSRGTRTGRMHDGRSGSDTASGECAKTLLKVL